MKTFIKHYFQMNSQLYLLHWQTTEYARHIAFGEINESLTELVDAFIEVYQGKNSNRVNIDECSIRIMDKTKFNINNLIDAYIKYLNTDINSIISEQDTDLLNIRDEIVALMNKLKYLLSLK